MSDDAMLVARRAAESAKAAERIPLADVRLDADDGERERRLFALLSIFLSITLVCFSWLPSASPPLVEEL